MLAAFTRSSPTTLAASSGQLVSSIRRCFPASNLPSRPTSNSLSPGRQLASSKGTLGAKASTPPALGTAAGAASDEPRPAESGASELNRRPGRIGKVLRRLVAVSAGAGMAGGMAMYLTDPDGVKHRVCHAQERVKATIAYCTEPSREKLLPDAIPPYPGAKPLRTLLVELDDTLIHSSYDRTFGWRVAKRPSVDAFLAHLSSMYEVVVFTTGVNTYADPILNRLDPNRYYIANRLYRTETRLEHGEFVKDLSLLNRDLSRVILIDANPAHYKYHPENAINVSKWTDESNDTTLLDLIPFLEGIVHEDCADVREELQHLRGKPLQDALVEYRNSPRESKKNSAARSGLFGARSETRGLIDARPERDDASDDGEAAIEWGNSTQNSSSVWGRMTRKGGPSVFRPSDPPATGTSS